MDTTAVVSEILVVGLQALGWIALLAAAFARLLAYRLPARTTWFKGAEAVLVLLLVALAYTAGVVVDRVADSVLDTFKLVPWRLGSEHEVKKIADADRLGSIGEMRLRVTAADERLAKSIEYQRSRLRVARATAVNLLLTTAAFVAFWASRVRSDSAPQWRVLTAGVVAGVLATSIAGWAAVRISQAQDDRLAEAYCMARTLPQAKAGDNAASAPQPTRGCQEREKRIEQKIKKEAQQDKGRK